MPSKEYKAAIRRRAKRLVEKFEGGCDIEVADPAMVIYHGLSHGERESKGPSTVARDIVAEMNKIWRKRNPDEIRKKAFRYVHRRGQLYDLVEQTPLEVNPQYL